DGTFLWPGYGENMRVLQWIVERCQGRADGTQSVLGWMPREQDLEWAGLAPASRERYSELMTVERDAWLDELMRHDELLAQLRDPLPNELALRRERLLENLRRSPERWTVSA